LRRACSLYKFICIKNLKILDAGKLDEFFDHTGRAADSSSVKLG
jgi:hypothetical protein